MAINFNKYAEEGNLFVKNLAKDVGHPEEISRTGILLRAVLHAMRERITISESFDLMAQLPMFIKALYADNWKYRETPLKLDKEDFLEEVKKHQAQYGESEFSWEKSTEELVKIVISEINTYVSKGEFEDITAQLPKKLKEMFLESIKH